MLVDVQGTVRKAIQQLEAEKRRIDAQITALQRALANANSQRRVRAPGRRRMRMGPAARRAVSQRMKAYWAKRRAAAAKGKGKAAS